MKKAIITYCDANYEWELRRDFLKSLRRVEFGGQVHILDYGLRRAPKGPNLSVQRCSADMSVEQQRNRDIVKALEEIDADVVMTIDAGDVWFQENFDEVFEMCADRIGYVEELDDQSGDHKKWFMEKIKGLACMQEAVLALLEPWPLIGSGMLVGPRDKLAVLLGAVYRVTEQLDSDFFGVDQIALNYAVRSDRDGAYLSLPQTYDYVLITHRNEYLYRRGAVFDSEGHRVKIAHNAGGEYRLVNRRKGRWKWRFGLS